jgi:KaiC/GvpD/RAD55 family RecA-like ATPase
MAVKAKRKKRAKAAKKAKAIAKPARKTARKAAKKTAKKTPKKTARKTAKKTAGKTATVKKAAKKATARKPSVRKATEKQRVGTWVPPAEWTTAAVSQPVPETSEEKSAWRISPEVSQSVLRIDTWKKDDLKIEYLKVYRTGWIIVDERPDLAEYNPDEGINIFEEFEFDEHELYDGSDQASIAPNELPEEERQRLLALSEEELAEEGWTLESVTRFKGPLVVEPV